MSTDTPARIAARWWADHLRTGRAPLNNGLALAMMSQAHDPTTPADKAQAFEDALAAAIEAHPSYVAGWLTVGVDYGPDGILTDAATKAGVRLTMTTLPWKTAMWVKPARVAVKCGYGAATRELFSTPTPPAAPGEE